MWNWKPAKAMLERLWNHGDLVVSGRQGFQRLYDLPERVLAKAVLDAPAPPEPERLKTFALKAVRARGALTGVPQRPQDGEWCGAGDPFLDELARGRGRDPSANGHRSRSRRRRSRPSVIQRRSVVMSPARSPAAK